MTLIRVNVSYCTCLHMMCMLYAHRMTATMSATIPIHILTKLLEIDCGSPVNLIILVAGLSKFINSPQLPPLTTTKKIKHEGVYFLRHCCWRVLLSQPSRSAMQANETS